MEDEPVSSLVSLLSCAQTCRWEIMKAKAMAPVHSATTQKIISPGVSALMSPKPTWVSVREAGRRDLDRP